MSFDQIGIRPARILLPAPSVPRETWACIACDQYTSEPAYWEKAFAFAGDAPSALRLILPEVWLKESEKRIPAIHAAMAHCLREGLLLPAIDKHSFFADVRKLGVLPRKTFSMGEADEKRFYMEAKEI